jgi:hypothetical protein
MSHVLFELLENAGFLRGDKIAIEKVVQAKRSQLVDVALQSADLTAAESVTNRGAAFTHTAPPSLSGAPYPCAGIDCRLAKARELAQFAAFYSDRVFINNGLLKFSWRDGDSLDEDRLGFLDELEVIVVLRPLIEAGLIVPITPTTTLCFHCLGKTALPQNDQTKFDRALRRMTKRFSAETQVSLERGEDEIASVLRTTPGKLVGRSRGQEP